VINRIGTPAFGLDIISIQGDDFLIRLIDRRIIELGCRRLGVPIGDLIFDNLDKFWASPLGKILAYPVVTSACYP
jgi:hypothetical protein